MAKKELVYQLKKMLLSGQKVTTPGFQDATGSWRCAVPVHYLASKHGWEIQRKYLPPKGVAQYSLTQREIERLERTEKKK